MKKHLKFILSTLLITIAVITYGQNNSLKIVFIRHGEKPEKGSNLTCKGLNRSMMLPALIKSKFGVPDFIYVPSLKMTEKTTHARMFETVIPLAVKYNLEITSKFEEKDSAGVAGDIMQKKGTVLVVWEHKAISGILHSLGIKDAPVWGADDFDTIYIITFQDGKPALVKDTEGLNPSDDCQ
jgi:hypothetical protein